MLFTTIFAAVSLFSATALASPAALSDIDVAARNLHLCPGHSYGQFWNGWEKSCKCDKDLWWHDGYQKCIYKPIPKPDCGTQKSYCGKDYNNYCEYNDRDDRCGDNGQNKVFCYKPKFDLWEILLSLKNICPQHPQCSWGQNWSYDDKQCKCPTGKSWRGGKCKFDYIRKDCGQKQTYCAKDKYSYTPWNSEHDWCQDDGHNVGFCAGSYGEAKDWCKKNYKEQDDD